MQLAYRLAHRLFLPALILLIVFSMPRCQKNNGPHDKNDSMDTLPKKVVYDSAKFHADFGLYVANTSGVFQDTFYDYASIVIYVVNGKVTIPRDSFLNDEPLVLPSSGSNSIYKAVWIPDKIGEINVTDAAGLLIPGADTEVVVTLTQTGTVTPIWQLTSTPGGVVSTGGGTATPGWPAGFNFSVKQKTNNVFDLMQPGSHFYIAVYKDY